MEDLEEDLTCSVCYSLFCDPRVLPCSHTFCKACLDRVLLSSVNYSVWRPRPLKCPNCRSLVELAPPGVEALPVNVSLRAIVEKYQKERPPAPSCCPEHPREPLNVYCVQDRQPVCGLCLTVGRHRDHAIDDLHAAFLRERQTLGQLLAALSEQRLAQVCELGQQLDQGKAQCEGLLRADRLAVEQYFQELELTLRRKKEACLVALEAASADVDRAYNPLIVSARSLAEEHCDLLTLGASVQEEDRPLEFLEQVHLLRERVERLTALPLPPAAAPSVAPRAGDFLRERWALVGLGALGEAPVPWVGCGPQGEGAEAGPAATTGGTGGTEGTGGTGGSQGTGGTEGLDQGGPVSLRIRLCLVGVFLLVVVPLISLAAYLSFITGLWEFLRTGVTWPMVVKVYTQIQRTMEVLLQAVDSFLDRLLLPG
ncbi:tripartite motif-containing protein 59 isoform X2 [Gadus morhua]|uniref:Tripartite motif containing 59 n=2 Tax=Gadus morhua TaxID=8049 RepID=A0A8C5CFT2_GADMO|nr:tripartite motif-containing protein 59 isoform X2 [Gadus morhua]XP_030236041.1 tripartite motif-containing protein 59 isoform X2 [Gadus morhua]